ncbi:MULTISPECIES: DNA polymerase I [unclassified Campylobacter]|uniref:DNA polymerase I n=1 Tax=unclassified Campylobacter TaxID=2593542 RepID=UPI001238316D|nr:MULTISPECIES: DNA polymerase I [unclassified Campylobacter]KAA6225500.1 DNA polymerase I [Campylobacter sp. LR196d]KAA6226937.1 DNA polymerase I [Campylobacter sp. LR185c]KAA6229771.1 DNA polymerase I [Campylobacter sp. LR286c]KAA6234296.1 DNA polymerase I [Campylobacter sp. LR291e]KAA8604094.1 DNA polymerase I [Campylobacter sp. LR185c]
MKTLTLIDSFGFFFRLFYALKGLSTSKGEPSSMITGFSNFIYSLEKEYKSDFLIFALDSKGPTLRSELFDCYKGNRTPPPPELKAQLPICIQMIERMGFASYSREKYEADDIIASIVKFCEDKDIFVRIVSTDKDLYQLIKDGKVSIYSPISKREYNETACYEKFGVKPSQIIDFLALCGDSADNIPGVKGIGEKGAKKLLDDFDNLENIYENLLLIKNEKTKQKLLESKESAFLSKKLATLYDNVNLENILENANFPDTEPLLKILDILEKYELNNLIKKLDNKEKTKQNLSFSPILMNDENELIKILQDLNEDSIIAFDTETTGLDARSAKIVGFSFCFNEERAFYVPINHRYLGVKKQISFEVAKQAIELIFKHFVIGHNLKFDFKIIKENFNINYPLKYADTMILAWLENSSLRCGMDELAKRLFDYETLKFEDLVKNGETFANVSLEKACEYASEDAFITLKFYLYFMKKLDKNLLKIAQDYEFDFIKVLIMMQDNGIKLDINALSLLMSKFETQIKILSEEIYNLSGERFNINSPKQIGEILFEKLNLSDSKAKTKTGYKTDEAVLSRLLGKHEIVGKILAYRELAKLVGTYCEPLLKLAKENEKSRIYSSFLQTGTVTGRLASKDPNLQNIPAHGQYAKDYKSCFIAEDGYSFISLDYSQIELRMLAHFSQDEKLLRAFENDEDIHARTAIMIFGYSDFHTRSVAKSINFGLIYGMGYKRLSESLKIDAGLAKEYIEKYFANFTSIKGFFEEIKKKTKSEGYISTLLGRRRYFDFSNANSMQVAMFERESINSILQGSAADIIKLAMLEFYKYLDNDTRLILQIHDELIFEVKDELCENFVKKARNIMENIVKLKLKLKTSSSVAKNWGILK